MTPTEEVVLRGVPMSKGIGIGTPHFFHTIEERVSEIAIPTKEVEEEVGRYRKALHRSREDLEQLRSLSLHEGTPEIGAILGAHLEMMQDPVMTTMMEERIRTQQKNPESIFHHLIEEYKSRFSAIKDPYFQERVRDIVDVSHRVLRYLRSSPKPEVLAIPPHSILLTYELVPSETVEANPALVSGFVTATGGVTSHAAIIARAKGIPYVANIDVKLFRSLKATTLIVDGSEGLVIVNPSLKTLKKYQALKKAQQATYRQIRSLAHLRGETIDGYEIKILANLDNPKEVDLLLKNKAAGVGLFRSEYLFLSKKEFPSEEEQFAIYRQMAVALKGRPLVIRIYDVGADKRVDLLPEARDLHYFTALGTERNPALGCRAIRFLLRYPELLKIQLRAILRASGYGEVHLLIPMVSDLSELRQIKAMVEEVKRELQAAKVKIAPQIPVGCMIEVPSSALIADALAKEADFLSIGTNDLVQYVMAADRSNPHTTSLYFAAHPSVLRLIRMIVAAAEQERKPLIVCGECAADPTIIPLLMGLGIREFSVAARHVPLVKHTIRQWRILEACRMAAGALEHTSADELKQYLAEETVRK